MEKHEFSITMPDGKTRKTVLGIRLCTHLAVHQRDDDDNLYTITHLPTGGVFSSFCIDSDRILRETQLSKLLAFFKKYGQNINDNFDVALSITDPKILGKNKNVIKLHKLTKFLIKRIEAIPTESLVGSFYRDEADFQKLTAETFNTELTYSGDAILSPEVIAECVSGFAKLEE